LINFKGCGEEQAAAVREQRLRYGQWSDTSGKKSESAWRSRSK
jgi:hypothetical protein